MKGKYLIFGATGGVGGEVCRQLVGRVGALAVSGRNSGKLQDMAAKMSSRCYPVDAEDWDAVDTTVKQAKAEMDGLDGVAICIGSILLKSAHLTKREELTRSCRPTSRPSGIVRAAAKAMVSTGGSIVLVSSAAAQTGMSNHEADGAAKAGIEGLTRSAAASYANRGIRVNCIAPGLVETNLSQPILNTRIPVKSPSGCIPWASGQGGRRRKCHRMAAVSHSKLDYGGQVIGVDGGLANCAQGPSMTGLGYDFLVLSQDTNQKSGRVEPIYHIVIFVILALVVASSQAYGSSHDEAVPPSAPTDKKGVAEA